MFKQLLAGDDVETLMDCSGDLPEVHTARAAMRIMLSLRQGLRCHYCKCQMAIVTGPNRGRGSPNLATFEHLIDAWSSETGKKVQSLSAIVMACSQCNNDRNVYRQQQIRRAYSAKFPSLEVYAAFNKNARPLDYINKFGVVPDDWTPGK